MKTIIIGLNWLGDIIMSLPAIIAATEVSEVHVVSRPHLAEVYDLFNLPLRVYPIATNAGPLDVIKQLRPLRDLKADHMIVLPDSLRAAMIAKVCNSKVSTGFSTQWRSLLLSRAVPKPADYTRMHESDLHFSLIQAAGLSQANAKPALKNCGFSNNEFAELASRLNLPVGRGYIILAPGAAFGAAKRWPPAMFAALADLVHQELKLPVVVTASASEQSIVEEIRQSSKAELINVAGQTSLKELACLLSQARALIANDSGTMHLAALYATPTVVPVGPTDMVRTGPLNENFTAIKGSRACPIAPCRQRTCKRNEHICMETISPEAVLNALTQLLSKSR